MHPENHCISCCEMPLRAASHSRSPQSTDTQPHIVLDKDIARLFYTTLIQRIPQTRIQAKFDHAIIFPFAYGGNEQVKKFLWHRSNAFDTEQY